MRRWRELGICLLLIAATLAVYAQVAQHDFVQFDDAAYVKNNPHVTQGLTLDDVTWAFTTGTLGNWHPLLWMSHMLVCSLFGLHSGAHHLVNVLLHIVSTLLLFGFLRRATGAPWRSAFVAALFALHPVNVEAVAWLSERKGSLSTVFWMLTLLAYLRYVERPGRNRYVLVLLGLVLGLMVKPMLMTLPTALLLLDIWPLRRLALGAAPLAAARPAAPPRSFSFLLLEKAPLFVVSLGAAVLAVVMQGRSGSLADTVVVPIGLRVETALVAYASYLGELLWPARLVYFYPHPASFSAWKVAGAIVVLTVLSLAAVQLRRRCPYATVGWLWFLGTFLPVIGLVQIGDHWMADRYAYVPFIGLFVIVAWGVPDLLQQWRYRVPVLVAAASMVVAMLATATWYQVGYWRDGRTLTAHALAVDPNNFLAQLNMGMVLEQAGQFDDAMAHYAASVRLHPDRPEAHNNLGALLARQGKVDEAIAQYREALQANPDFAEAHTNLGAALAGRMQLDAAIAEYREALRLAPDLADTHYDLGVAWLRQGNMNEAVASFSAVVRMRPDDADAYYNLGLAFAALGHAADATVAYRAALRARPGWSLPAEKLATLPAADPGAPRAP